MTRLLIVCFSKIETTQNSVHGVGTVFLSRYVISTRADEASPGRHRSGGGQRGLWLAECVRVNQCVLQRGIDVERVDPALSPA